MDVLLMAVAGFIVSILVMTHNSRAHDAMDQRIFDREFKTIVENYV